MNDLFYQKLKAGMTPQELTQEVYNDLADAIRRSQEDKKNKREEDLKNARALLKDTLAAYLKIWGIEVPAEEMKVIDEYCRKFEEDLGLTIQTMREFYGRHKE